MNKSVLTLALLSLLGAGVQARTLSPAEALARAARGDVPVTVKTSRSGAVAAPVMTFGEASAPSLYVFDGENAGYLIVAADDVAAPVLGYSDSGTFDPDNIPVNLRWWFGEYCKQIESAVKAGATEYKAPASRADWTSIAPMIATRWDQGAPYWNMCPEIDGERTVTGCVATAMAQVMKYFNWPERVGANANFSYEWRATGQKLEWDASGETLDWANMLDTYRTGAYNETQANAVAKLMKVCGYSVGMNYNVASTGGSGASDFNAACALVDYFDYDKGINVCLREYYTAEKWQEMVYDNLRTCGPVLYAGSNDSAGHAFVCDGYRSEDGYFHFNWGWSGYSDGYFLLNALDPDNQGIGGSTAGYNNGQSIVLGIKKPGGSAKPVVSMILDGKLSAKVLGKTISLYADGLFNYSTFALDGSICAKIVPEKGGAEKTAAIQIVSGLRPGYGWVPMELGLACNKTYFPDNGTYKVSLAFKSNADNSLTDVQCSADQPGYVLVTRAATKYTVTVPTSGSYSVNDLKLESPIYPASKFLVTGNALWSGATSVTKNIFGVLMTGTTANTAVAIGSTMPQDFKASNEPVHFDYLAEWIDMSPDYEDGIPAGEYCFAMAIAEGEEIVLISNPINVTVQPEPRVGIAAWSIDNADAVNPQAVTVRAKVTGVEGDFNGSIIVAFFDENTLSYVWEFESSPFSLAAGESTDIAWTGSIPGAVPGARYLCALYNGSEQLVSRNEAITITIANPSGIDDIILDSSSLSVSPNPAVDYTVISAPAVIERIDVCSLSGSMVNAPAEIDGTSARLDVSALASGLYVARVTTAAGVRSVKIIKK